MGESTCGASEQDQLGDPDRCPSGWENTLVAGQPRLGYAARNLHNGGVEGTLSFCGLCGQVWGEALSEEERKAIEGLARGT